MVDMQLTNNKLIERGTKMIMEDIHCGSRVCKRASFEAQIRRNAVEYYINKKTD